MKHERRTGDKTWISKGRRKLPELAPEKYLTVRVKLDEVRVAAEERT